jgi:hypothetical protein
MRELSEKPELPESMSHLWSRYLEILAGRQDRITYADLDAYERVTGVKLLPFEARTIMSIDATRHKTK